MTAALPRVEFDTTMFLQALISERGAAAACLNRVRAAEAILLISDALVEEMRDVFNRPRLRTRFRQLDPDRVNKFILEIIDFSLKVPAPPCGFVPPRDPDDGFLIDLGVAGGAGYLVTWNERHLTYLMKEDTSEGLEFRRRFPSLQIVSPPAFLAALDERRAQQQQQQQ